MKLLILFFTLQILNFCNTINYKSINSQDPLIDKIEKLVIEKAKSNTLNGISVAIVESNKNLFLSGYGRGSKNTNIEINDTTLFKIGSISKVFTALLIMKLVETGKINLDKPIDTYIKEFSINKRYISNNPSIRQLLTHHGGMPSDIFNGFDFPNYTPPDYDRKFTEIPDLLKKEYSSEVPGKVSAYSNISYGLLGLVIERVSGKKLNEYANEVLFRPLNMQSTSYLDQSSENVSSGFLNGKEISAPKIRDLGAGSVSSNAKDMANLMKMLINLGKHGEITIFKEITLVEMFKIQNKSAIYDGDFEIGIPFWIDNYSSTSTLFTHGGDLPPFHAQMILDLKNKTGITVMTNTLSSSLLMKEISLEILKTLNPSLNVKNNDKNKIPSDTHLLLAEGNYINNSSILKIKKKGSELETNLGPLYLEGNTNNRFQPLIRLLFGLIPLRIEALKSLEFSFNESSENKKYSTLYFNGMPVSTYIEFTPTNIHEEWKKRLGNYKLASNDKNSAMNKIKLSIEDNILVLQGDLKISNLEVPTKFLLRTSSDKLAFTEGVGRNSGLALQFIEDNMGGYLLFYGFQFKRAN